MSKKLTLEDRYYISMYSRRLPCTIALRYQIDKFFDQIEITSDEIKQYEVKIDENLMFTCNDENYTVEYEEFPEEVIKSMKAFIVLFDHEKNKNNEMVQRSFTYFKQVM